MIYVLSHLNDVLASSYDFERLNMAMADSKYTPNQQADMKITEVPVLI